MNKIPIINSEESKVDVTKQETNQIKKTRTFIEEKDIFDFSQLKTINDQSNKLNINKASQLPILSSHSSAKTNEEV